MFKLLTSKSKSRKKGLVPNPAPDGEDGLARRLPHRYSKPLPIPSAQPSVTNQYAPNPYSTPYPNQYAPNHQPIPSYHFQPQPMAPKVIPPLKNENVQYTQFSPSSAAKAQENFNQRNKPGTIPYQLQNEIYQTGSELDAHHPRLNSRYPAFEGRRLESGQVPGRNLLDPTPHRIPEPQVVNQAYRGEGAGEVAYNQMSPNGFTGGAAMHSSASEPPITPLRVGALPPRHQPNAPRSKEKLSQPTENADEGLQGMLRGQPMRATLSSPDKSPIKPRQPPRWKFLEELRRTIPESRPVPSQPSLASPAVSAMGRLKEPVGDPAMSLGVRPEKDETLEGGPKLKSLGRFIKAAELQQRRRGAAELQPKLLLEWQELEPKQNQPVGKKPLPQPPVENKLQNPTSLPPQKASATRDVTPLSEEKDERAEKRVNLETEEPYLKVEPKLTTFTDEAKASKEPASPALSEIPNPLKVSHQMGSGPTQGCTASLEASQISHDFEKHQELACTKLVNFSSQGGSVPSAPKATHEPTPSPSSAFEELKVIPRPRASGIKPRPKTIVGNLRSKFEMKVLECSGSKAQPAKLAESEAEVSQLPKPTLRPVTGNSARRKLTKSLGTLHHFQPPQLLDTAPLISFNPPDGSANQTALKWKVAALSRGASIRNSIDPPPFLDTFGKKNMPTATWLGSPPNSLSAYRLSGAEVDEEHAETSPLALQLEIGELRIQLEMWRKKFREAQLARSDLEAEFATREGRTAELHAEETANIKTLCSRRIRELVHVIRELQHLNLQFRTLLVENHIGIPGIDLSPLLREPEVEPMFSPPAGATSKKQTPKATASKLNLRPQPTAPARDALISPKEPSGSLTPLTMYKVIEERYRQIVQNDPIGVEASKPLSSTINGLDLRLKSQDDSRINQLLSSIERTATAMAEMDSTKLPRHANLSLSAPVRSLGQSPYSQFDAKLSPASFTLSDALTGGPGRGSPNLSPGQPLKRPASSPKFTSEPAPLSVPEGSAYGNDTAPQRKLKSRLAPSLSSLHLNLTPQRLATSPLAPTPPHPAKDYPIDLTGLAETLKTTSPAKSPTASTASNRVAYPQPPNSLHRPLPQVPNISTTIS